MAWTHLVILLALFEYIGFGILVGRARERYGVKAPAITGNEIFERYFRVQQNTLELLILFVPAMLITAQYWNGAWVALVGL
ncbi:MAG TPA: MAPEG family protein, partial [Rudaea sp.]|nr:MAPEG family protein [Rudaea sp.]